jgi:surface polysaccharide O-acyltransferase-like enzyme
MTALSKSETEKKSSERVFALDALRAIMMMLGIVIHASITYGVFDYKTGWSFKDSNTNPIFDLVVSYIHSFRMPVFFVVSGYFGALLFYKKGPKAMLMNRYKRIVLPLAAGVLIIWPLVLAAFVFSNAAFSGSPSPLTTAMDTLVSGNFLPFNVAHLWFLCKLP